MIGKCNRAAETLHFENAVILGGICGNLASVFLQIRIPFGPALLCVYGISAGIFVGSIAVALAEILNTCLLYTSSVKDYIRHPKESGYKSYHRLLTVPIFLSDRIIDTNVEIQIRTMAMDFWASLEHKIYYRFEGNAPDYISRALRECSGIVSMLDAKMLQLNEAILRCV